MNVDLLRTPPQPRTLDEQIAAISWHAARARPYCLDRARRSAGAAHAVVVLSAEGHAA